MIAPRRFLPSMSSLLALEAVERLGTATAVAEELALTHSAVSRQLKVLEEQIGVTMFRRAGKGLALTPAGVDYARTIRGALQDIARASLKIRAGGSRTNLNLAILPSFGALWLGPRLRAFSRTHGELNINLSTRLVPFDFGLDPFDGAIHYGRRDWQGVEYLELTRERVIPAAAPSLLAGPVSAADLLTMPLLHLESRPGAWEAWFEQNGCKPEGLRGMLFDQFTALAEAAVLGFGLALLPEFLAEREFRSGRLVPAATGYTDVDGAYFLVWPANTAVGPAMSALIDWLRRNA
jgi:LysR family transcriptional regulator, glycine cleavage system transcriptional activator